MKRFAPTILCTIAVLCGCGPALSPDEQLAKEVFDSIKQRNVEEFSKLTITLADFELKKNKVSPFKAGLTYAGGTLRPEMRQRQQKQFEQASTRANENCIDFATCEFAGITGDAAAEQKLLDGGSVPVRFRQFKIQRNGKVIDATDKQPVLVITDWNGHPRLLSLLFKEQPKSSDNE